MSKKKGIACDKLCLTGCDTVPLYRHPAIQPLEVVLPLAISFFTFQQIAYLVDSYKKESKAYDFLNYAVFVCFFPFPLQ